MPSVTFLFVPQISREPLNRFAPNSQGRHVWTLARMSLNVKVKGRGHQGQKTCLPLPSPSGSVRMVCARCKQRAAAAGGTTWNGAVRKPPTSPLPGWRVISGACMWCTFGKTSLALVFWATDCKMFRPPMLWDCCLSVCLSWCIVAKWLDCSI